MLNESFGFRLSTLDKRQLMVLAQAEQRTPADVLRRLIRQAAEEKEADLGNQTMQAKHAFPHEPGVEGA